MGDNLIIYSMAAAAGLVLQLLIRLSGPTISRKKKLFLNIGKCMTVFCIHVLLLFLFWSYNAGDSARGGTLAASFITLFVVIAALVMQYLNDRKYPMTDMQKLHLSEL